MRRSPMILPLLLALAGCGDANRAADVPNGDRPRTNGAGAADVPAGAPEGVRIRAESFANGDVNAIVEAHGRAQVGLRGRLEVERLVGDDWTAADGATLELRADCATPPPECVTLVQGGGLRPPRWNARIRGGQCDAAGAGTALPSGRYRFVATSCSGNDRVEGLPFDVTR